MYSFLFILIIFAVITPLFGFGLGSKKVFMYSTRFLFLSTFISFFAFYDVVLQGTNCEVYFIDWFNILNFNIKFGLYFDSLSTTMFCLVIFISSLVHLYSQNYMSDDPHKIRFFFYLSLFTFFMCLMVLSPNLVQFFFAWEGVGLASYLLINFWFTRYEANRSAMKAMMMNRFGDFGLYFALLLCFTFYKTTDISTLNSVFNDTYYHNTFIYLLDYRINLQELICFFLFLAVVGKSAQLGLHTWLPDAMEGPTPVSALLHAATMVTAGVYLLLRLSYLFSSAPLIMSLITVWGALTAFYAATIGAFQYDIKKIIAYSTCSQLGYMISACGLYNFSGSFFHLFNHAFFKALLFLGAGAIIHSLMNEQDLRKYGALFQSFPLLFVCMLIGSLSLSGFPFLSGFYSKDNIINWSYSNSEIYSNFSYWLLLLAAFFTAYYSSKLLNLTFFTFPKYPKIRHNTVEESDHKVLFPVWILTLLSIFSGYLFYDIFIGYGTQMMGLYINPLINYSIDLEYVGTFRKNLALLFVVFGVSTYFYFHYFFLHNFKTLLKKNNLLTILIYIKNFFNKKWFVDYFYSIFSIFALKLFYNVLFKTFERGVLEDFFIKKPIYIFNEFSKFIIYSHNSTLNNYVILIINLLFLILLLFFLIYFNFNHKLLFFVFAFFFYKFFGIWKK